MPCDGAEHGQDVLNRYISHDVVYLLEYKASFLAPGLQHGTGVIINFFC